MTKNHLVIVNLHSAANAGDHALFQVLFEYLVDAVEEGCITLAVNDPKSFGNYARQATVLGSFFTWLKKKHGSTLTTLLNMFFGAVELLVAACGVAVFRITGKPIFLCKKEHRPLIEAYYTANTIVSCPGNFIYSRAHLGGLPLLSALTPLFFAWLAGKPFWMAPQTIGPLWRKWERWLVRLVLQRAQFILLRDPLSASLLDHLGIPPTKYRILPDLAFLFEDADYERAQRLLKQFGDLDSMNPRLGITVLNWSAQHPRFQRQDLYERSVADLIDAFLCDHPQGHVFLFPQVWGPTEADDDRIPAHRIQELLKHHPAVHRVHVVCEPHPPSVLRAAYQQMDLFVGSRLHSNIFALTCGVPVIAIAYQDKTHGVMRMLGLSEWVLDINSITSETLVGLYRRLWSERGRVQRHIEQVVPACKEQLKKDFYTFIQMSVRKP